MGMKPRALASPPVVRPRPRGARRMGSAVKKSELYSSLWASCDELRGGMDASQYKDYVLVTIEVNIVGASTNLIF